VGGDSEGIDGKQRRIGGWRSWRQEDRNCRLELTFIDTTEGV